VDRDKVKKVPDARVQDALDELYDALDEIYKEINKLKSGNEKDFATKYR
jgi:hypothetical protein